MKLIICILLFWVSLCAGATNKSPENTDGILRAPIAAGISGFGLEVLLTRLNYIDRKLMLLEELQMELKQHREQMDTIKASVKKALAPKTPPFTSCKDVPSWAVSGAYAIRVNNVSVPFKVYCEQEQFGGGWIVVQHRFDGSVDFYRNWEEYGFGEPDKEFWLALEQIHQLTSARKHELVIEMKDFEGNYGYASYNVFEVGSESEQYCLKDLGTYSGTADDGLTINKMAKFSTRDRDNDGNSGYHFAGYYEGGWWYGNYGGNSNLNGRYQKDTGEKSNWWWNFHSDLRGTSFTRMMIREF
ncbi:angiopoietin-1-like [Anopheles aquasalis]|uniref:angiopoietin-1-like n=1 Tax=Anopheles aquasalis TaxID=42839 RepID=UPI00215B4D52|nr:angiopoietin-1-like [Anopheles aquasalis]